MSNESAISIEVVEDPLSPRPDVLTNDWHPVRLNYVNPDTCELVHRGPVVFIPTGLPITILEQVINDAAGIAKTNMNYAESDNDLFDRPVHPTHERELDDMLTEEILGWRDADGR